MELTGEISNLELEQADVFESLGVLDFSLG